MTFVLAILLIVFVLGPIARAAATAIEKGGEKRAARLPPGVTEQMDELSEQVRQLAARVDALSEEQSFLLRLMEEQPRLLEREPG